MHKLTLYPLGNADSYRVDLENGKKLLFDYADKRNPSDPKDKRAKLPDELRADLSSVQRDYYDIVAFTHFDDDHVCGAPSFFELEHATKYQGLGRTKIRELWVPAWAITESPTDLCEDGRVMQAEARYRLKQGRGIRVFSRPEGLRMWLEAQGLTLESRQALITDAGVPVPGWGVGDGQGVEFFVHSPFATRQNDGTFADRNTNCLVLHATFASWRLFFSCTSSSVTYCSVGEAIRQEPSGSSKSWMDVPLRVHLSFARGDRVTARRLDGVAVVVEGRGHLDTRGLAGKRRGGVGPPAVPPKVSVPVLTLLSVIMVRSLTA